MGTSNFRRDTKAPSLKDYSLLWTYWPTYLLALQVHGDLPCELSDHVLAMIGLTPSSNEEEFLMLNHLAMTRRI